jgi:hypothetical protein
LIVVSKKATRQVDTIDNMNGILKNLSKVAYAAKDEIAG